MTLSTMLRRTAAGSALLFAWTVHTEDAAPEGETAARSVDGLVEVYRRSLAAIATGEPGGPGTPAVRLADAEARFAAARAEATEEAVKRLTRAELAAARAVAAHDLEALVPVISLHHEVTVEHVRRRRPHLREHAATMVRVLADFYAREALGEGAHELAARWLASLAGHFQASGSPSSPELFERSLALDEGCEPALFGLAAHWEKRGGPYPTAVAYLERLHEIAPGNREARLRLAINLERVGRGEEARRLLEETLAAPATDWIDSLAAQELARWRARDGLLDEAVAVLEEALRRRPDDQKLHVLLALLHDQNREPRAARRLAGRLRSGLAPIAPARGVYNRWPSASLAASRAELRRAVAERLPLLRAALAAEGDGE